MMVMGLVSVGAAFSGSMQSAYGGVGEWDEVSIDQAFWLSGGAFLLMVLLGFCRKTVD